ncbi:hypothetical protein AB205_0152640 [Aquarana catesbeiana]|uniref:MADF domain-containing protein n=1 Tax=Aquarana catesbeiana TaxID=8400 RepID=A0A2G9Q9S2_AQUCT|nr:hypothetical protein AB205_0152640 [Aquarana catesbeiana]PIO12275.1 hypothetical protein AB205_0152640 [Aquarana catesbeiana]
MARDVSQEELINLVHERPGLWDSTCRDHSDRVRTQQLWDKISKLVTQNWSTMTPKQRDQHVHQTSECEENTENNEREAVQKGEQATQVGEGQSQSMDETAHPSARPRSSQRSVHVSHDRPTSQSSRRGKKPENPETDKAMKTSFKKKKKTGV